MATLRRRWPLILGAGLLAATLAFAAVWFLVPGRYAATIIFGLSARSGRGEFEGEADPASFARLQMLHLKEYSILQELLAISAVAELREVHEHGSDVAWLKSALVIDQPTGTGPESLRVTLQGENPEDISTILNELGKSYLARHLAEVKALVDQHVHMLNNKLNAAKEKLSLKQKEISDIQQKLGLQDQRTVDAEISRLQSVIGALNLEELREIARKRELEDDMDRIKNQIGNPAAIEIPLADINEALRNHPEVREINDRLARVEATISKVDGIAAPGTKDRATAPYRKERDTVLSSLRVIKNQLQPEMEFQVRNKAVAELLKKQVELQRSLERANSNRNGLREQITGMTQQLNHLKVGNDPAMMLQLTAARLDEARLVKHLDDQATLVNKAENERNSPSRVKVVEQSQPPKERTIDRKLKFGAAAAVGGFALAFLCVALLDFRLRRVNSVADITQGLGLPVVGTLPLVPNRDARQLLMLDDAEANAEQLALREAVDGVRTVVLHAGRKAPLQVLLVSSALNGEGKTTLASQLATSLARSGRRTLLLDCDLRNPSVAELFNRPGAPGFCEVLRGEVTIEDAIQPTEQAQLFIVPAGVIDGKALQALAHDVPGVLLDRLREHFDFIVIDTSPVLPVSDALQIGAHADAVLIAIMEQSSQLPAVHQAQQKLISLQIRILGAVVGGTKAPVYLYGSRNRTNQKSREAGS